MSLCFKNCTKIYIIMTPRNPNLCYVGSTTEYMLTDRLRAHIRKSKAGKSNTKLHRAMREYPDYTFEINLLERVPYNHRYIREQYWIEQCDSIHSGWNMVKAHA